MIRRFFPAITNATAARAPLVAACALLVAACALLVPACAAHPGVETQTLPDGTLRIKCEGALPSCLARAEGLCKGTTYEVVRARDQRDRYGPELGTAQVEVRSSEAFIRCGSPGRPLFGSTDPLKPPPPANTTAAATAPPPPARACVPGATQACIGPGKCEGGQSCLPDGTAFGPCDCGTLGAPIVAPAGPAPPPATATAPTPTPTPTPTPAPTTPNSTGAHLPPAPAPTYKPQNPPASPLKAPPPPPPPVKAK